MKSREQKVLFKYFTEFTALSHELQLADTDEEVQHVENEINRIRKELKEHYPIILKEETYEVI